MEDNRPYKIPWPKGLKEYILEDCARHYYMFFFDKARAGHMHTLRDGVRAERNAAPDA